MRTRRIRAGAVIAMLAFAATGCGGGSKSSGSSKPERSATTTEASSTNGPSVFTGPVHATLSAENHAPMANKPWAYSVHVTNPGGHGLNGTVAIQFTYGGQVVGHDTPPVHPVKNGQWHDTLTFPNQAIGQPLNVQAVVHTTAGSVTLNWPITVQQ